MLSCRALSHFSWYPIAYQTQNGRLACQSENGRFKNDEEPRIGFGRISARARHSILRRRVPASPQRDGRAGCCDGPGGQRERDAVSAVLSQRTATRNGQRVAQVNERLDRVPRWIVLDAAAATLVRRTACRSSAAPFAFKVGRRRRVWFFIVSTTCSQSVIVSIRSGRSNFVLFLPQNLLYIY